MSPDDVQMRDILATKEYLMRRAEECQTELDHMQRCIKIVDSFIAKSSFTRASQLPKTPAEPGTGRPAPEPTPEPTQPDASQADSQPIVINSQAVAHTTMTPDELRITIGDGVILRSEGSPLKTFFVDRIIGSMRSRDEARAKSGGLNPAEIIECTISEDEQIRHIAVRNYRDKERADEIIKSVSWSLSRMVDDPAG